jgi:tRNA(Met) C34 N-acetyltransferase TmcA
VTIINVVLSNMSLMKFLYKDAPKLLGNEYDPTIMEVWDTWMDT